MLDYLKKHFPNNKKLTVRQLTQKVTIISPLSDSGHPDNYLHEIGCHSQIL